MHLVDNRILCIKQEERHAFFFLLNMSEQEATERRIFFHGFCHLHSTNYKVL